MAEPRDILAKLSQHMNHANQKRESSATSIVADPKSDKLDELLGRIAKLAGAEKEVKLLSKRRSRHVIILSVKQIFPMQSYTCNTTVQPVDRNDYYPVEPKSFREAKVTESMVDELISNIS